MADLVSNASAEQQAIAKEQYGWKGPEDYKGDPAEFTDADKFIEIQERVIIPKVRMENKRLKGEVDSLRATTAELKAAVDESKKVIVELKTSHSAQTARAVEDAKAELRSIMAAARKEGDFEAEEKARDEIDKIRVAEEKAKSEADAAKGKDEKKADPPATDPKVEAWQKENKWFGKDKRKTYLFLAIRDEFVEAGRKFSDADEMLAALEKEFKKTYPDEVDEDNVEGSRNGSSSESFKSAKSYAALSRDAKAACDDAAETIEFGEGKVYKNLGEFRSAWVAEYNKIIGA